MYNMFLLILTWRNDIVSPFVFVCLCFVQIRPVRSVVPTLELEHEHFRQTDSADDVALCSVLSAVVVLEIPLLSFANGRSSAKSSSFLHVTNNYNTNESSWAPMLMLSLRSHSLHPSQASSSINIDLGLCGGAG